MMHLSVKNIILKFYFWNFRTHVISFQLHDLRKKKIVRELNVANKTRVLST